MKDENPQFYFQGLFFDTFEEMMEYGARWNDFELEQETAERILDRLSRDILINIFVRSKPFKNKEFVEYVNEIFDFSMKELIDRGK